MVKIVTGKKIKKATDSSKSRRGVGIASSTNVKYADVAGLARKANEANEAKMARKAKRAALADIAKEIGSDAKIYKQFLRRDTPDIAEEHITFEKGVTTTTMRASDIYSSSYRHGMHGEGFAVYTDDDGQTWIEADNVIARKKLKANVIEIKKEYYTSGNLNLTEANGTVSRVVALDDKGDEVIALWGVKKNDQLIVLSIGDVVLGDIQKAIESAAAYKLFFVKKEKTQSVQNMWQPGDLALCKELNIHAGECHSWHRVVTSVGSELLEDGVEYNYIVVSNARDNITVVSNEGQVIHDIKPFDDSLMNSTPRIGDAVVQCGSVTSTERQGVTRLTTSGKGDGGLLVHQGVGKNKGSIKQFQPNESPVVITPNEVRLAANKIELVVKNADGDVVDNISVGDKMTSIVQTINNIMLSAGKAGIKLDTQGGVATITLTADNVQLEGAVTANGGLQINNKGSLFARDATIINSKLRNVLIEGALRTPFRDGSYVIGGGGGLVVTTPGLQNNNNVVLQGAGGGWITPAALPWTIDYNGFRAIVMNDDYGSATTGGNVVLTASPGKYFFENGIKKKKMTLHPHMGVEMIGYGDHSTFKGWMVIDKIYREGYHYGYPSRIMYSGHVTSDGYLDKLKTYNGEQLRSRRQGRGSYEVTFSEPFSNPDNYMVMLTGAGLNEYPHYASVIEQKETGFLVYTGDDASPNDGGFNFIVINTCELYRSEL